MRWVVHCERELTCEPSGSKEERGDDPVETGVPDLTKKPTGRSNQQQACSQGGNKDRDDEDDWFGAGISNRRRYHQDDQPGPSEKTHEYDDT